MQHLVLDASVILKWFLPFPEESYRDFALDLRDKQGRGELEMVSSLPSEIPTLSLFHLVRELGTGLELDILEYLYHQPSDRWVSVDRIRGYFRSEGKLVPIRKRVIDALTDLVDKRWADHTRAWEDSYRISGAAKATINLLNEGIALSTIYVREAA